MSPRVSPAAARMKVFAGERVNRDDMAEADRWRRMCTDKLQGAEEECWTSSSCGLLRRNTDSTKGANSVRVAPFVLMPLAYSRVPPQQSAIAVSSAFLICTLQFRCSQLVAAVSRT